MVANLASEAQSAVWEEASQVLTSWAVPLYRDERTRPRQVGTGFFVYIGRDFFLISAAHVLRQAKDRQLYYFVEPNKTRSVSGELRSSKHDIIDVAALKLDSEPLPPYPAVDKVPMPSSVLRPRALPSTGKHYMVSGFPSSKNRANPAARSVDARAYTYRTDSIAEAAYLKLGIDPAIHIALPLDLRHGFDSNDRPVVFPDPHGMSGAPVWMLHDENDQRADQFSVVGVTIEYRRLPKLLVATDVEFIISMLAA